MSFDLLSEPLRRYIREKRWEQLRPIQHAAIQKILSTDNNYILASRTASGKTEAAFLPILSKVDFREAGVQVLYISPLIALINDQFLRVEELCKHLDIPVTKWHGEASKSLKDALSREPRGVVLITPESVEAMFINKPYQVKNLFANLKFVVIDEIHSFIGSDRGVQLKSILSRLQDLHTVPFTVIGLSATIGDYIEAKRFTGNEANTKVLLDKTAKDIRAEFRYFKCEPQELSVDLLKDLYLETKDNKVLIFPNSRGKAEEVAVKLKKISRRVNGHSNYFSHHSSVDKEVREYVEYFAKNNTRLNFCICCTSTLELGIDIGSVDEVVQIDSTHSISSLIQRVGRSGRKDGESSQLFLYATDPWNLLQSLACWLLYKEGFIEPPHLIEHPYDILLHQILSIVKGHSGMELPVLKHKLKANFAFSKIPDEDIHLIIDHLISIDFLEKLQNEVLIGVEGEKVVNSREMYSVFKTEENFKVVNAGSTIGQIPYSEQIREDENILLSARIWKIKYVDFENKRIEVIAAKDGKKPKFSGGGGIVHGRIRAKMMEILFSTEGYDFLDVPAQTELQTLRNEFKIFTLQNIKTDKPLILSEQHIVLSTFAGTTINKTFQLLLNIAGIKNYMDERSSSFELDISFAELMSKWKTLINPLNDIELHLEDLLQSNPALISFSKWGEYLPLVFQISLLKQKLFDFQGVFRFIQDSTVVAPDRSS